MSEPTREHVEAVARVLMQPRMFTNMSGDKQRYDAAAILTSTDPAVLDAMQDALVRAGRLTMSWHEWGVQRPEPFEGVMQNSPPMSRDEAAASAQRVSASHDGHWQVVSRWRFYTPWRAEAPDA